MEEVSDPRSPMRQTRGFECPRCAETYLHDDGYRHDVFTCPLRPTAKPIHEARSLSLEAESLSHHRAARGVCA